MLMSPPYQVIISPEIWGRQSVTKQYPPNCKHKISFTHPLLINTDGALFSFQTYTGLDYFLEFWSLSIKNEGIISMNVMQPFIGLVICLKVGDKPLAKDALFIQEQNFSLCYFPKGLYDMFLPKGDTTLVMIIPPLCYLHSMAVEHLSVRDMYSYCQFGEPRKVSHKELPLPQSGLRTIMMMERSKEYAASLDLSMRGYILQLFSLYNEQLKTAATISNAPVFSRQRKIEQIVTYIHDNLLEDKLNETKNIARAFMLSLTTIRQEFKLLTGKAIQHYIRDERLAYARRVLEQSGSPVLEIARIIQYSSTSSFKRAYKRKFGHLPGVER